MDTIIDECIGMMPNSKLIPKTTDAAPYLKTLPGEMPDVQNKVAQSGNRLTELESQLSKYQDLRSYLRYIGQELAKNKKLRGQLQDDLQITAPKIIQTTRDTRISVPPINTRYRCVKSFLKTFKQRRGKGK